MNYEAAFSIIRERRGTNAAKWQAYDPDVLPMWVADMDFPAPEEVMAALRERVSHGIFGYPDNDPGLTQAIQQWLQRRYGWAVAEDAIILLPGVVPGFNLAAHLLEPPFDGVLIQTPVYPPFLHTAQNAGARSIEMPLTHEKSGTWSVDLDRFQLALAEKPGMFLLCNPHNPVGRVFTRGELQAMADLCLKAGTLIVSDEIHADLVYPGHRHIPIATLSPEIADITITLMAPSKTFNIAGLQCAFAVISNPALRRRYRRAGMGLVSWVNLLGQTAARAAYENGEAWLNALLVYLTRSRDLVVESVRGAMPELRVAVPEGTYLAWIDCRAAGLEDKPAEFFLEHGRVAFNEGATFGTGGEGFIRLNFGCPRALLEDGLNRMKTALAARARGSGATKSARS